MLITHTLEIDTLTGKSGTAPRVLSFGGKRVPAVELPAADDLLRLPFNSQAAIV